MIRRENNLPDTPLWNALCRQADRVSFHMPAHRQGRVFSDEMIRTLARCDTTELERTGDLAEPEGHVRQAYELAARFFGAGETWFITTGTTTAIRIMLACALREGDEVVMPRAVHMAAVHAAALLGLRPRFVRPNSGKPFRDGQPDAESFIAAMRAHPQAKACYVTRPDYYGNTVDLLDIAEEAHRLGMVLLVDEAHGAHFVAAPEMLPPTALSQGADIAAQSAHKTLPALTPASLLHLSGESIACGRISPRRCASLVRVFQTSSPSFLIAASTDIARAMLERDGRACVERLVHLNRQLSDSLPVYYRRICPPGSDLARLVIDYAGTGLTRAEFAGKLDQSGIDAELVDSRRAVFIPSIDQPEEDYAILSEALCSIRPEKNTVQMDRHVRAIEELESMRDSLLSAEADFLMSPRQALFGSRPDAPLHPLSVPDANRLAAEPAAHIIAPYPPGMPIVWPGEPVTEQHRRYLRMLTAADTGVRVRE